MLEPADPVRLQDVSCYFLHHTALICVELYIYRLCLCPCSCVSYDSACASIPNCPCVYMCVYIVYVVAACVFVALCACLFVALHCLALLPNPAPPGIPISTSRPWALPAVKEWTPAPSCLWGTPGALARQRTQPPHQAVTSGPASSPLPEGETKGTGGSAWER